MKFVTAVFLILYAFCEFQLASEAISIRVPTSAPGTSSSGSRKLVFGAPGGSPGARGPQSTNRLAKGPVGAPGSPSSRGPPNPQQCPGDARERQRKAQERADQILKEIMDSDESTVCIHPPPKNSQRFLFQGSTTLL